MKKTILSILVLSLMSSFILPNSAKQVNAATYYENFPTYSLFTKESIIEKEIVSYDIATVSNYMIDENLTYEIVPEPNSTHDFYIPFASTIYQIPNIEVKLNDKIIETELLYGDSWHLYRSDNSIEQAISKAYKPLIDENLTGTLYTVTAGSNELTITYKKSPEQTLIYDCGNSYRSSLDDNCVTYTTNVTQGQEYTIFVVGDNLEIFETENTYTTSRLTCKQYIDNNYLAWEDFYTECNVDKGYLYSEMSRAIYNKATIRSDELFLNFDNYKLNFFKFSIEFKQSINTITYSQKARIQGNNLYDPIVYMFERKKAANYLTEYSVKMTSDFPYVIESNIQLHKDGDTYRTSSTLDSFYCVYSSDEGPTNKFDNSTKNNNPWLIIAIGCALILIGLASYIIIKIIQEKKSK